ncbi:MAG: formylglycine-generating enzyme family protein, partial [Cyanobacteria bacterium P01_E01_bin.34]
STSTLSPELQRLISILRRQYKLTGREVADIIWLALQQPSQAVNIGAAETVEEFTDKNEQGEADSNLDNGNGLLDDDTVPEEPQAEIAPTPAQQTPSLELPQGYETISIPDAPALVQMQLLARELRPLARQVEIGPTNSLDEEATVDCFANTQVWQPQLKAESELWLELVLVLDTSPSMALWQRLSKDLRRLMSRYSGFRDVRIWKLTYDDGLNGVVRVTAWDGKTVRNPKELISADRRRLVAVVSDCVAPAWWDGRVHELMALWSSKLPLVIFQVFPERLWARTGLLQQMAAELQCRRAGDITVGPDASDRLLPTARSIWDRDRLQALVATEAMHVPIVSFEKESLRNWAQVVAGDRRARVTGVVWDGNPPAQEVSGSDSSQSDAVGEAAELTTQGLVNEFLVLASEPACELAELLASAPVVTLPIVRLIQRSMLPTSSSVHVAEVLMSGLFEVCGNIKPDFDNAEFVAYRLVDDEVRAGLQQRSTAIDGLIVLERVSAYVARGLGRTVENFKAQLRNPDASKGLEQAEFLNAFAKVTATILRGLGRQFEGLARTFEPELPETLEDEELDIFQLEELEFEWGQFVEFPALTSFEFEAAKIVDVQEQFEFETATISLKTIGPEEEGESESEWIIHREPSSCWGFTESLADGVELQMVAISEGELSIGEGSKRQVVKVPPFYMGCYAVTQAQWKAVSELQEMEQALDADPSNFKGANRPVERVSWDDAQEFCRRLSQMTGQTYRLPSEAEWEYACRAGTETEFHFGDTLSPELANYRTSLSYNNGPTGQYREETTDVGSFPANEFGLHDMHGNVDEWCEDDWRDDFWSGEMGDARAWVDLENSRVKVLRGGSWYGDPVICRSASRLNFYRVFRYDYIGFRVVCESPRTLGT